MIRALAARRDALIVLTERAIREEYAGSALGALWAVCFPAALGALYWFLFTKVLRTPGAPEGYALFLLAGLIPWFGVQQAVGGSLVAVREARAWFTRTPVGADALVASRIAAALLFQGVATAAFAAALGLAPGRDLPALWWVAFPASAGFALAILPWCAALSLAGGFLRDLGPLARLGLVLWFFGTPIVYGPGQVPSAYAPLVWLNPLAHLAAVHRAALLGEGALGPALIGLLATGAPLYALGAVLYGRVRREAEDLL